MKYAVGDVPCRAVMYFHLMTTSNERVFPVRSRQGSEVVRVVDTFIHDTSGIRYYQNWSDPSECIWADLSGSELYRAAKE